MDYQKAHTAAVKALAGHGITAKIAEGIVFQMENLQHDEWTRTLDRVATGEAKHVRVFVAWEDAWSFRTFIYSGDKDSTVAAMFRAWGEFTNCNVAGDLDTEPPVVTAGDTEVVPVACFDIGKGLSDALRS